jgi:hypothetical protein
VFTLADSGLSWDLALSSDSVNFSSPVFQASGYGDATRPIVLSWDGIDRVSQPPRMAAPARYRARLRAGGSALVNTSVEMVVPPMPGYTGVLSTRAASAIVKAIGPGATDGSWVQASATGYFLLRGLRAGQAYQLSMTTVTTLSGVTVTLSTTVAATAAASPPTDVGNIVMSTAALLRVAAVLPVPAPSQRQHLYAPPPEGHVGRHSTRSRAKAKKPLFLPPAANRARHRKHAQTPGLKRKKPPTHCAAAAKPQKTK